MKKWLYRMEYKYGKNAVNNLMLTVVIGMAIVYLADRLNPTVDLQGFLYLYRPALAHGQLWRLITFIFLPPTNGGMLGIFGVLISLYFYYFIGSSLERTWGSFRFDVYYLCGVLGAVLSCLLTGYADNYYLNMSLFFAFAALYPDMQVLLFYFIPIKVKWLALLDAVLFLISFVTGGWPTRVSILMSLINFFLFFGPDVFHRIAGDSRYWKDRALYRWRNRKQ